MRDHEYTCNNCGEKTISVLPLSHCPHCGAYFRKKKGKKGFCFSRLLRQAKEEGLRIARFASISIFMLGYFLHKKGGG